MWGREKGRDWWLLSLQRGRCQKMVQEKDEAWALRTARMAFILRSQGLRAGALGRPFPFPTDEKVEAETLSHLLGHVTPKWWNFRLLWVGSSWGLLVSSLT